MQAAVFLVALFVATAMPAHAEIFTRRVVGISDGDTLTGWQGNVRPSSRRAARIATDEYVRLV